MLGVTHAIICSIDSLVNARHNEIRNEILYLSLREFSSASIHAEPLIHLGRTRSEQDILHGSEKDKEAWGDVMTRCLWDCQINAIIGIKIGDTDTDTYRYEPMIDLMYTWEKTKKDKHVKHCHNQQKHFSMFVLSVNRMLGKEALVVISQLI